MLKLILVGIGQPEIGRGLVGSNNFIREMEEDNNDETFGPPCLS